MDIPHKIRYYIQQFLFNKQKDLLLGNKIILFYGF